MLALILPFILDYAYLVNALFWAATLTAVGLHFRKLKATH